MQTQKRVFRISRYKPDKIDPPKFQNFEVLVTEEMSVLDVLEKIRLEQDTSLMYRHSCHHSACGTCACKIDGTEKLTCITKVFALNAEPITLEPLDGFHREGDLVVDMTGFYAYIPDDWHSLRASEQVKSTTIPDGVDAFRRLETCIECGSCVSACPAVHKRTSFMGPAALAAINNELATGQKNRTELLALAGSDNGEHWCERAIKCSRVCPTKVAPARHIAELRKTLNLS